jgi:hypothetical protein
MAGITLEQAQQQLQAWLQASMKVASNQSYEIGGRKLTRADAADIQTQIKFWDDKAKALTRAAKGKPGMRVRYGTPRGGW